jgi:hypothetical protein
MPETTPTEDVTYPDSWLPTHVREERDAAAQEHEVAKRHLASLDDDALLALIDDTLAKRKS